MTVKRRVKKLEETIGGTSDLYYVYVFTGEGETREQALERTLKDQGLTMADVGRAAFFDHEQPDTIIYRPDIPADSLLGREVLTNLIKAAAEKTTLDPPHEGEEA
jgi:hypothetical protein